MQAPRAKPVRSSTASTPELEEAKDLYNDIHIYFDHLHDVFNDFADEEGHLPPTAEQFLNDYKAYLSSSSAYQPTTNIPSRPWRKSFPPYFPPAFFQSIHMKNPSTFTPVPARVKIERVRVSACFVNSITNDDKSSSPAVKLLQQSLNAIKSIDVSSTNKRKSFSALFDLFLYLSTFTSTQTTSTQKETKKSETTTTTTTTTTTPPPTLPTTPEPNKRNSFWNVFDPFFYFTSKPEAKSSKVEGQASTLKVETAQEIKPAEITIESVQEIKPAEIKVENTQEISSTEFKVETVQETKTVEIAQETKPAELNTELAQETKPAELSAESTQETKPIPEIDLTHKVTINVLVPAVKHNVVETSTIDASKVKLTEKDAIEAPTLDAPTEKTVIQPHASKTTHIKGRKIERVKHTKSLSTCKEETPKLESFPTPMFGRKLELVSQLISFTKSRSIRLNFASMRVNVRV